MAVAACDFQVAVAQHLGDFAQRGAFFACVEAQIVKAEVAYTRLRKRTLLVLLESEGMPRA
jgi:acid phosphatase family membrane protein YuiD